MCLQRSGRLARTHRHLARIDFNQGRGRTLRHLTRHLLHHGHHLWVHHGFEREAALEATDGTAADSNTAELFYLSLLPESIDRISNNQLDELPKRINRKASFQGMSRYILLESLSIGFQKFVVSSTFEL